MDIQLKQIIGSLGSLRVFTRANIKARGLSYQFTMVEKALKSHLDAFDETRAALYKDCSVRPDGEGRVAFIAGVPDDKKPALLDALDKGMKELLAVQIHLDVGQFTMEQIIRTIVDYTPANIAELDWLIKTPTAEEIAALDELAERLEAKTPPGEQGVTR